MTEPRTKRIAIIVFDALRPEFIRPELMPALHAFAAGGVMCGNSHSTFLTETRVNQSAVTSGCMAYQHGLVANRFVIGNGASATVLNTGDDLQLEAAFKRMDGRLIQVPTLGEMLTQNDKHYASLSAGTAGGGRLINHSAEADGTFRYAMRRPDAACPAGVDKTIEARFGPLPKYELPATAWITRAADIYLDYIEPEVRPDVMLLWLCEPDESFHHLGIGSEGAMETMRHVDRTFARILARHNDEIERGDMQIIAMSDHGQITLEGERLDITARLRAAGFKAGKQFDSETDCIWAGANAGGLWVRDGDAKLCSQLTAWLLEQDWCGPIFTRAGVHGTLRLADVFLDHARAPDVALTMRTRQDNNLHGLNGLTMHDSIYPVGGGSHGGLSRAELHNFIALGGRAMKSGVRHDVPVGNIDLTPTVLALLGLPIPTHFDGRAMLEAFADGPRAAEIAWASTTQVATNTTGPRTHLRVSQVGTSRYVDEAWVA